jgi:hypothetical protein
MNKKTLLIGSFSIVFILSFLYGVAVPIYKLPPYDILDILYDTTNKKNSDARYTYSYSEINVNSLIQINNLNDILLKRSNLIQYIWKQNEFPYDEYPTYVITNLTDENYSDLQNLSKIEKITTKMEYEVISDAYLFLAKDSNNKLVLYHQGHDGDFILGKKTIQFFLNHNYSVLAFSMPLVGSNNRPVVDLPNFGRIQLVTHDDLQFLETDQFTPIKYFVHPITVSLNYVEKNYDFDSYYMVGISGGGWTTAFYSALDTRINKNYPVAGTAPMYLRFNNPQNMGDYEQMHPDLYDVVEYLDQYIMASYGEERGQLQIFNKYDPCCFSGTEYTTYESKIKERLSKLGSGNFSVFLDEENKQHSISDRSLDVILQNMQK